MERAIHMMDIANRIEQLANEHIDEPISITYELLTAEGLMEYSEWQRKKCSLTRGEEYFFISRTGELLYTVCVTCDSVLTAAKELMDLIARKF